MSNPNAIISTTIRLIPSLDGPVDEILKSEEGLKVELEGRRLVRLDPEDSRSAGMANVLDGLRKNKLPVYIEINQEKETIVRLLIPFITRVVGIDSIDNDQALNVSFEQSHGRHLLRRDSEDFKELEDKLNNGLRSKTPLIITEEDVTHEIIDIRDYDIPEELPPSVARAETLSLRKRRCWPWQKKGRLCWPWASFICVSKEKAQQVFDTLNATSCDPLTVPEPCIPFLYPDDGCWGRAHEMCRLMKAMNLRPRKVWIQGSLHVATRNKPNCNVNWNWHVAPILCVRSGRFLQSQKMVIDPSLFRTPVPVASWKGVQDDPNASLTYTDASVFHLWNNTTDPTYVQTNQLLATYRLMLQNRSVASGPPPYANCR